MSSGLVPIVSRAGAVPEFVDDDSGILVQPENVEALAAAMAMLADQPALFARLSQGAAAKVQQHIAMSHVIARELEILKS
jgi:glycosyltransferase involved in cell wall biosynthesis